MFLQFFFQPISTASNRKILKFILTTITYKNLRSSLFVISIQITQKSMAYNYKQHRVLWVIVLIQKAIEYFCMNKIHISKHGSCSIQCTQPCGNQNELKINWYMLVTGFQSWAPEILSFDHPKVIIKINSNVCLLKPQPCEYFVYVNMHHLKPILI
jgi:hypothetical protein